MDLFFCYVCFLFVSVMLSCMFLAALGSPGGKGLTSWLSCVLCFLVLLSLSHIVFRVRSGILIVSIYNLCLLLYLHWMTAIYVRNCVIKSGYVKQIFVFG